MIGLRRLASGPHALAHPDGPLFLIVRRRRVVYAELHAASRQGILRWTAGPGSALPPHLAGYLALAEKVVVPIA